MNRIPFEAPNKWSENDWKCEEIKHSNLIFCLLAFLQTSVKLVDLYCLSPWCWSTPKETERIKNGPSKRGKENQERIMEIRKSKAEYTLTQFGHAASERPLGWHLLRFITLFLEAWPSTRELQGRAASFGDRQGDATQEDPPPLCAWTPRLPTLSTREWPHLLSHP